jgi:ribosomal protein S6--L-glutamate ligase
MSKEEVGRTELVSLVDYAVLSVPAKIDTGAYLSAIHATNIQEVSADDGSKMLQLHLLGGHPGVENGKTLSFSTYKRVLVENSFGHKERRYAVELKVRLRGKTCTSTFTLSDRSTKAFPVLIGRKLLNGRFVVDTTQAAIERSEARTNATNDRQSGEVSEKTKNPLKIAILSNGPGNYSTKRLKQEFESKGHVVKVVKYKDCYASIESSKPEVRYQGRVLSGYDVIVPRIASSMTRYGTAILRQFEMQGVYTTTSSIAIARSRDKLRSLQVLARSGVGIPKTVFTRNSRDIDGMLDEIGDLPVIIKLARGTHGNGVVLAETKKAAKSVMQAFYVMDDDGTNILLQEFIKESAGEDIRVFIVDGKVVASMKRKGLDDDFRSNLHQGGQGEILTLKANEKRIAQKAAKAMGLSICGVDIMRSKHGPLVLEVNSSPGFAIEKVTGVNIGAKIVEYVEKNAKLSRKKDQVGA